MFLQGFGIFLYSVFKQCSILKPLRPQPINNSVIKGCLVMERKDYLRGTKENPLKSRKIDMS